MLFSLEKIFNYNKLFKLIEDEANSSLVSLKLSINKLNNFRETWHEHIALLNTKEFSWYEG